MAKTKIYPKQYFKFINRQALDGDIYFQQGKIFITEYPFFKQIFVVYKLCGDVWIEQKERKEKITEILKNI
jgi:hypothetical protein